VDGHVCDSFGRQGGLTVAHPIRLSKEPAARCAERLTGFRETDYADTRAKLMVEDNRLKSLVNGKSYGVGRLELVSLETLRERVKSAGGPAGRLSVSLVSGDVREMHRRPEYLAALFQVASQFNLLEMVGPDINPEHGVTRYQTDRTQGPACAIAAGAATIYRNYFAEVEGRANDYSMAERTPGQFAIDANDFCNSISKLAAIVQYRADRTNFCLYRLDHLNHWRTLSRRMYTEIN
jgi:hypothetical protein